MQSGNILTILFLKTGVPQRSVLAPLLFFVCSNDLPEQGNQSLISLFAGDTTVYKITPIATKDNSSNIQSIRKQFDLKKLTVSTIKSDYICFRRFQRFGKGPLSLEGLCKYLCVMVDWKLSFKEHISQIANKLTTFCGFTFNVRHLYRLIKLLLFYETLAKPVIAYGLMHYGATAKTDLDSTEKAQRRIVGAVFFKKQTESRQNVYGKRQILTIHEMCVLELTCELIWQLKDKSHFDFVTGNFIPGDRNTRRRQRSLLKLTYNRTSLKRRSLGNSIVRTYNWLMMLVLIPQNMKILTENATKNLIHNIAHMYVSKTMVYFR